MVRKFVSAGVCAGLLMYPFAALAQSYTTQGTPGTTTDDSALIAALTALVQVLEQELQNILATRQHASMPLTSSTDQLTSTQSTPSFSSGAQPLSATIVANGTPFTATAGNSVSKTIYYTVSAPDSEKRLTYSQSVTGNGVTCKDTVSDNWTNRIDTTVVYDSALSDKTGPNASFLKSTNSVGPDEAAPQYRFTITLTCTNKIGESAAVTVTLMPGTDTGPRPVISQSALSDTGPLTATLSMNGVSSTATAGNTVSKNLTYIPGTNGILFSFTESKTGDAVMCKNSILNNTATNVVSSDNVVYDRSALDTDFPNRSFLGGGSNSIMSNGAQPAKYTITFTCTNSANRSAVVIYTAAPVNGS